MSKSVCRISQSKTWCRRPCPERGRVKKRFHLRIHWLPVSPKVPFTPRRPWESPSRPCVWMRDGDNSDSGIHGMTWGCNRCLVPFFAHTDEFREGSVPRSEAGSTRDGGTKPPHLDLVPLGSILLSSTTPPSLPIRCKALGPGSLLVAVSVLRFSWSLCF